MIALRKITAADSLYDEVFRLRDKVLRQPLGMSLYEEDTSSDREDDIFIAEDKGRVIGCLMAKPMAGRIIKLRQMAVDNDIQKQGVGRLLVEHAEKELKSEGIQKIVLHARAYALGFYEKLGYTAYGSEFEEVGIPHFAMEKRL